MEEKQMTRSKFSLLVVGALIASLIPLSAANAAAPPAQTRTLPSSDTMYSISCPNSGDSAPGQLASVNTTTSALTNIGSGTTDSHAQAPNNCAEAATYNPVTDTVYWTTPEPGSGDSVSYLFSMNYRTGASTFISELTASVANGGDINGKIYQWGLATDSRDGKMYSLYADISQTQMYVGQVNVASGELTNISAIASPFSGYFLQERPYADFAFNPTNSVFYVVAQDKSSRDSTYHLYTLDPSSGAVADLGSSAFTFETQMMDGLSIDSNGTLWGLNGIVQSATISGWATPGDYQVAPTGATHQTYVSFIVSQQTNNAAAVAAAAAAAAAEAQKQREITELLSVIPAIAGLALNLIDVTNSLLFKQKCVKGKSTKYVKYGAKCPTGYKKKK